MLFGRDMAVQGRLFDRTMCKISRETVRRATQRTIARRASEGKLPQNRLESIVLHVRYRGGEYNGSLSMSKVREAYGRAVASVDMK